MLSVREGTSTAAEGAQTGGNGIPRVYSAGERMDEMLLKSEAAMQRQHEEEQRRLAGLDTTTEHTAQPLPAVAFPTAEASRRDDPGFGSTDEEAAADYDETSSAGYMHEKSTSTLASLVELFLVRLFLILVLLVVLFLILEVFDVKHELPDRRLESALAFVGTVIAGKMLRPIFLLISRIWRGKISTKYAQAVAIMSNASEQFVSAVVAVGALCVFLGVAGEIRPADSFLDALAVTYTLLCCGLLAKRVALFLRSQSYFTQTYAKQIYDAVLAEFVLQRMWRHRITAVRLARRQNQPRTWFRRRPSDANMAEAAAAAAAVVAASAAEAGTEIPNADATVAAVQTPPTPEQRNHAAQYIVIESLVEDALEAIASGDSAKEEEISSSAFLVMTHYVRSSHLPKIRGAVGGSQRYIQSARRFARDLFDHMRAPRSRYVTKDDLERVIGPKLAQYALDALDEDNDGKISSRDMRRSVPELYRTSRIFVRNLTVSSGLVDSLDSLVTWTILFLASLTLLALASGSLAQVLITLSTLSLSAAIIFGNTLKNLCDAVVFLFVMHPFDVGDRVFLGTDNMVVQGATIWATQFEKITGETVYIPNTVLMTRPITNVNRSGNMWDVISIQLALETPTAKYHVLERRIQNYLTSHPTEWQPVFYMGVMELDSRTRRMVLSLWVGHTINWQNSGLRFERRTRFFLHLREILEEEGFTYVLPEQPITIRQQDMGAHVVQPPAFLQPAGGQAPPLHPIGAAFH